MSERREGEDCCEEKSPLARPPLLLSTPRDDGGDEKSGIQSCGFCSQVLELRFTERSVCHRLLVRLASVVTHTKGVVVVVGGC